MLLTVPLSCMPHKWGCNQVLDKLLPRVLVMLDTSDHRLRQKACF